MPTLKITQNQTLTPTLTRTVILNLKKANERYADKYSPFCFTLFKVKFLVKYLLPIYIEPTVIFVNVWSFLLLICS